MYKSELFDMSSIAVERSSRCLLSGTPDIFRSIVLLIMFLPCVPGLNPVLPTFQRVTNLLMNLSFSDKAVCIAVISFSTDGCTHIHPRTPLESVFGSLTHPLAARAGLF